MIKFKPDLFSLSGPNWHKINKNDAKLFKFSGLPEDKKKEIKNILKIRGLEINSSNLLLEFRDSKIVAKKLHSLSPYKYKDLVNRLVGGKFILISLRVDTLMDLIQISLKQQNP